MSAALDVVTLQFLHAELKALRAEELGGDRVTSARDLSLIEDDSIVGNSDKMLFHMKELVASIEDPSLIQNPFVMTKLDLKTINDFNFDEYQGNEKDSQRLKSQGSVTESQTLNDTKEAAAAALNSSQSDEKSIEDTYMAGLAIDDESDDEL